MVRSVVGAVSIPVRVMLRERPSMSVSGPAEKAKLQDSAAQLAKLGVDGIVTGFVREGEIDEEALRGIISAAPHTRFTFHRAFERVTDATRTLTILKRFPQVDRLLTAAGRGEWDIRLANLADLQRSAAPEIRIIFADGKNASRIADLQRFEEPPEVHVGRAARHPQTYAGVVTREKIGALKRELNRANRLKPMRD